MKSTRRIAYVAAIAAVVVGLSACGSGADKPAATKNADGLTVGSTIRIGAAAGPPFMIKGDDGEWTSFSAALAREFGAYEKVKIEFVNTTFPLMVAGLQSNKYDFTQPINATDERKAAVDFADGVSAAGALFFVPAGSSFTSVDDFNKSSVTIATISGSAEEQLLHTLVPKATIRSLPNASVADLATEVTSGRSNVMINSSYLAPAIKTAFDLDSVPNYDSDPDGIEPQSISFAVRKGDTTLLKALNHFIKVTTDSGDMKKLAEKWLTVENALKG